MLNEQQWRAIINAHSLTEVNAIVDAAIRDLALGTVKNARPTTDEAQGVGNGAGESSYGVGQGCCAHCPDPDVCRGNCRRIYDINGG